MATLQESFGARVRERRTKMKLSQAELAERIGWNQPDISDLENGHHAPSLTTIERLADALEVSPKFFFNQP